MALFTSLNFHSFLRCFNGPLKHLKNEWKFKEVNNATQLEFFIDFELKNPILNGIMKKSFELGLNRIAKAFEERAIKLYK